MQVVTIPDSGPWVTAVGPRFVEPFKSDSTHHRGQASGLKMASRTNKRIEVKTIMSSESMDIPEGIKITVNAKIIEIKDLHVQAQDRVKKTNVAIRTTLSHVKNLITSVTRGCHYKMHFVYASAFPSIFRHGQLQQVHQDLKLLGGEEDSRLYSVLLRDDYGIIDVAMRVEDGLQRFNDLGRKDFKEFCAIGDGLMTLRTSMWRLTMFWRISGNWSWVTS
ncbi:Ribosomal protein [Parasponia andersonii]|uniref:Ribosomal protein n=1 Tax=Parasponia andersonii TaxID=3476 RepID=A0A2P5CPP9_PARAD|nr:Ribosomal protein [Parasponia andersonii]